jgi:hypothetical protein
MWRGAFHCHVFSALQASRSREFNKMFCKVRYVAWTQMALIDFPFAGWQYSVGKLDSKRALFVFPEYSTVFANYPWRENGGSCTVSNFITCTHPQISLDKSSQGEWGGRGMLHACERREKCTRFWWESPREGDHLEDQGVGGKMGSEWILGRLAWGLWIGFDWLRRGTGDGLLWVRWWTFGLLRHGVS